MPVAGVCRYAGVKLFNVAEAAEGLLSFAEKRAARW